MSKYIFLALSLILAACAPAAQPSHAPDMIATSAYLNAHNAALAAAMTSTAQAPLIAMQQTSAAVDVSLTLSSATQYAAQTSTAQTWTATPDVAALAEREQLAIQIEREKIALEQQRLALQRAQMTNKVWAILPAAAFMLALVLAAAFAIAHARKQSVMVVPVAEDGNPHPLVVDGIIRDPLRERMQLLPRKHAPAMLPSPAEQPSPAELSSALFPLPAWEMFTRWTGGANCLPISISADGIETWDYAKHPHISVFGKTGSGKSRMFNRPLIAAILAGGHHAVIIGKHLDYLPFVNHPNAYTLPLYELSDETQAQKYADALTALVLEKNNRAAWLAENKLSTWGQAQRPNTFVLLDELSNALHEMPRDIAQKSLGRLVSLINEGRKVGMSIVFSSQRAKGFIDLTSQCGRVVFMVANDQESNFVLGAPGAEQLPAGYFFSRFTSRKLMGAFHPSDDDLSAYLAQRAAPQLPRLNILDLSAQPAIEQTSAPMVEDDAARILQLRAEGKTESAIVREMYETTGGGKFLSKLNHVRAVIKKHSATTSAPMPAAPALQTK